ncbi:MAG TPA: hypothetical protein VJM83_06185 [Nitrospirota bacterium]|nr:hypothetical protein [Nitrospirota bacterium]
MRRVLASLTLLLGFAGAAFAHSALNRFWGEVPVDMLLSGDVLIVKPLVVPEDVKLTIDAGTVVRFEKSRDGGNRIIIRGELVAAGTKEKPIRFVPKDGASGPWYGIEFAGPGRGRIERCIFEKASAGLHDPHGRVQVRDVSFR